MDRNFALESRMAAQRVIEPDPARRRRAPNPYLDKGRTLLEQTNIVWPTRGVEPLSQAQPNPHRTFAQYIGAVTLLAHVMRGLPDDHPERPNVERALVDANVLFRQRKLGMYFERAAGGGYAVFDSGEY